MFSFVKQKEKRVILPFPPGGAFAHKKKLFVHETRKSKLTVRLSKETSYRDLIFYFSRSFFSGFFHGNTECWLVRLTVN